MSVGAADEMGRLYGQMNYIKSDIITVMGRLTSGIGSIGRMYVLG